MVPAIGETMRTSNRLILYTKGTEIIGKVNVLAGGSIECRPDQIYEEKRDA